MQVRHSNTCCQNCIIRMLSGHGCSCFSCKIVKFNCGNTWVKPIDHFHCNGCLWQTNIILKTTDDSNNATYRINKLHV